MDAVTGQTWVLACDTCTAGDRHHYHPWLLSLALVSLTVAAVIWLAFRRSAPPVLTLGRSAALLLALGPVTAGAIAASTTEGRYVPCSAAEWSDPTRTGPCVDHGTFYLGTADALAAVSMTGGAAIGLAAAAIAVRRRSETESAQEIIAQV